MEFLFQFLSDIFSTSDDASEIQPAGFRSLGLEATDELLLEEEGIEEHNIFSLCEFH